MKPKTFLQMLKDSYHVWDESKAAMLGAALSYYTVFSLAPLLVIALAVAGFVFGPKAATGQLAHELEQTVGPNVAVAVQDLVQNAHRPGSGPLAIVIGVVVLLLGASGVFTELQRSLNVIWQVEPKADRGVRGLIRDRFLSFTMVLGMCFLLLVSLVVTTALTAINKFWTPASLPGGTYLWEAINLVFGLIVIMAVFAMIYKYLPDAQIAWRDVWTGAAVTAVLFTLGKYALGLYLAHSGVTSSYGAAGSLALIFVWVYYSAQIFLFGAAFTRVYADHAGRRIIPAENAVRRPTKDPTRPPEPAFAGSR
ncbi:MAG: YihY/virulence factor BrkB family protein [Gemmataceae bacterium]